MRRDEVFPSRWLQAGDLADGDNILTIDTVTMEKLKNPQTQKDEEKPVITFHEDVKPMVCNVTNWKAIEAATGEDDTDNWSGKKVALFAAEVEAFGEIRLAIRVRGRAPVTRKPMPGGAKPVRQPVKPTNEREAGYQAADEAPPFA